MTVAAIPEGFHSITAYLCCRGAADALAFYADAFGAEETLRLPTPDGKIAHAEIRIGSSIIMLADEDEDFGNTSPAKLGGTTVGLMIYTEDCDAMFAQALSKGATETRPLTDQFYGDRSGTVTDPWGHQWTIATHIEDVSEADLATRMQDMFS